MPGARTYIHTRRDERSIGTTDLKLETTAVAISVIANASGDVMDAKRITASMNALVQPTCVRCS